MLSNTFVRSMKTAPANLILFTIILNLCKSLVEHGAYKHQNIAIPWNTLKCHVSRPRAVFIFVFYLGIQDMHCQKFRTFLMTMIKIFLNVLSIFGVIHGPSSITLHSSSGRRGYAPLFEKR